MATARPLERPDKPVMSESERRSFPIAKWHELTTQQLADKLEVHPVTINKWARALGLPPHRRGPARGEFRRHAPAPAPAATSDDPALDALLAVYGRPKGEPTPPLPADLVAQLNTMTLAVVRDTVVSLMRESVAQLAPPLIEQAAQHAIQHAIADYTRTLVLSLIRLAAPAVAEKERS